MSLKLREERKLGVCDNRVPREIFGSKRDEVTGEWGKPHHGELNDLYFSPNSLCDQIEKEISGACSTYGGKDRCLQLLG
jgi:hypothetical protein